MLPVSSSATWIRHVFNSPAKFGANESICLSGDEFAARVQHLTAGQGVDVVLEAVGRPETIAHRHRVCPQGGHRHAGGQYLSQRSYSAAKGSFAQLRLQGSCASAGEYTEAIRLIASGAIQVSPLITAVSPLEEGASWFERLHAREPNILKVVLDPRREAQPVPNL